MALSREEVVGLPTGASTIHVERGSVFAHGMLSMGILGRALTDWAGVGNLKTYRVRFTKQTWPGETLTTRIVVTGKSRTEEGKRVSADVELRNQDGEVKLSGSAVVAAA